MPAGSTSFSDADWRRIDLPHDWTVELPFKNDPDLQSKGFYPLGRKYPENSIGWYRRIFELAAEDTGKRITIEFDGAYRETTVVFNGFYIGQHSGGYDSFSFDVSDFANPGQPNVLLVRVDATGSDGWFYEGAGIYRHDWLVKTHPVHVKQWGTLVRSEIRPNAAGLSILGEVENHGNAPSNVRVISTIVDPSGAAVAKDVSASAAIGARDQHDFTQEMVVSRRNLGYDPQHVVSVPVPLHEHSYLTRETRAAYFRTLKQRIAAVPGVTEVARSAAATPPDSGVNLIFEILGAPSAQRQYLRASFVDPEYFSTLRIPLLQGRLWNESENARGGEVAVINQTLARRYFPNGDAIGRQIRTPTLTLQADDPGQVVGVSDSNGWLVVVGIVADSLNNGLDKPVEPALYVPDSRFMWTETHFLIRTQSSPLAALHDVQRAILSVNPDQQTGSNVRDLNQWIEQQPEFKQQRLFSILFGLFSGLALALALAGLYSVVSYSVAQRTNEFGIRMALGARRTHVLWIVCRNIGATVFSGLLAGILIFLALQSFLAHWTQNSYSSPLVIVTVAALFILCAASACTIPALRATFIDPMQAVRYE